MAEWKPLNMEVRTWVISHTLRLEQASSDALKAIFRMVKEHPNTLGNKSSALSFKSKIDLLYDLEEIDKEIYNHSIKIMEIRNQFAHNPEAISFESFDLINSDIIKYLKKNYKEPLIKEENREEKLRAIFSDLFTNAVARISVIEYEYLKGLDKDYRKHINNHLVENIDSIWEDAIKRKSSRKQSTPSLFFLKNSGNEIEEFYSDFKLELFERAEKFSKEITNDNIIEVLKGKETVSETLLRLEREKAEKTSSD